MPKVDVQSQIRVPAERVWTAMLDIESFPDYMPNVLRTEVVSLGDDGTRRVSAWSARLKGSVLEWVEDEHIDHGRRCIEFTQIDGDLDVFQGTWQVVDGESDGETTVRLQAEFEIGIPLLADMLNPVAARALRDNQEQMLRSLEARVLSR
jgi:ribosome-associated toxin RatA of RatAB toxin-antitoxin module